MTSSVDVAKDLFCGCISGWGQVVSMLPFQNIKIKVISRPEDYNQGYIHALKKTIAEEGALGLYKGMLFPLIGVGAQVSVQFGFVETLKKMMRERYADAEGLLHWKYAFLSGFLCGIPSAAIVTPLDHARFKVTLTKQKGEGSVGMAIRIFREHGLSKLYLGFVPTVIRECIGLGCYFGLYHALIRHFTHDGKVNLLGSLLSGGLAGVAFWCLNYPADYVKTVIQADSLTNPQYRGMIDCFRQEYKKGWKVLFKGMDIMVVRAMVANSFGFLCFELAKRAVY